MEFSASSPENETLETIEVSSSDRENFPAGINRLHIGPDGGETGPVETTQTLVEGEASKASALSKQRKFGNSYVELEVGMAFHSEHQAYSFYNDYAQRKGFSVRKGHLGRRKDGTIRNRVFLCSNEGSRQKHRTHITKKPREVVRTNCMARIEFKVGRDDIWIASKVIYEHNHPLVRPHKAHLLRSHRRLLLAQHPELSMDADRSAECVEFPLEEAREAEAVGFLLKDQSSYLHTTRMRELEKGDAQYLLEYLKARQLENPSFFYAIQLDDKEQVTNFFWADARSIIDYQYFGDVVLFDTTYQTNKSELPFAPFLGINHHKQIVVFGGALLLDETTESFVWLFKTFLIAMSYQQPKTIFTDNCPALARAISLTLSQTCHRLCLWHILQNAAVHVSQVVNTEHNFQKDFASCIYESSSEEDFRAAWINLINKYDLASNAWLQDLYAVRDTWALFYQSNSFCATMTTLRWIESMRSQFKKLFNRKLPLSKFVEQYCKTLVQFHEKELYEDHKSRQTKPILLVEMPMLSEAAQSYTRFLYSDFEEEFKSQLSCLCEPIAINGNFCTYRVSPPDKRFNGRVEFDASSSSVTCSCKKFETMGILCMHALKVLNHNNVLNLPPRYILKRWTKYANVEILPDKIQFAAENDGQDALALQYNRVWRKAISIAVKSAFSEDALQMYECELDKLAADVENILHTDPFSKQADDEEVSIVDDLQQNVFEKSKRKRGRKTKGENEKRKHLYSFSSSFNLRTGHQTLPDRGITRENEAANQIMVNDSTHVTSYNRNGAPSYCNQIPMQPLGCSFSHETIMPTQEQFVSPQGIFDHGLASEASNSPNLSWCTPRLSVGAAMPVVAGEPHNFVSWMMQSQTIPMVSLSHNSIDQQMHTSVPNQQESLSRKLNFDINKGN